MRHEDGKRVSWTSPGSLSLSEPTTWVRTSPRYQPSKAPSYTTTTVKYSAYVILARSSCSTRSMLVTEGVSGRQNRTRRQSSVDGTSTSLSQPRGWAWAFLAAFSARRR